MKTMQLSALRTAELAAVIDSIPLKDLATLKEIRLTQGLVRDLQGVCQEYVNKLSDLQVRQEEVAKAYRDDFFAKSKEMSDEEKKKFESEMTIKLNKELEEKFGAEVKTLNETAKGEVSIELGDEKMVKLKELFEKYAHEKYNVKAVYLEVAEKLGL